MKNDAKRRWNIIDVLFIAVLVGVVISLAARVGVFAFLMTAGEKEVTYTLKIIMLENEDAEVMAQGTAVYINDAPIPAGKIEKAVLSNAAVTVVTPSGSQVDGTLKNYRDVVLTVRTDAMERDEKLYTDDGTELSEGTAISITVANVRCTATIEKVLINE